jgi:NADH:ubiquinone oxidoreductase subunit 4 (subunit M)
MVVLAGVAAAGLLTTVVIASMSRRTYGLAVLRSTSFPWRRQAWLFWTSIVACGLTAGLFPLHAWYAQVSRALPLSLSLLTGALVLNLGVYGLLRISISLFPLAAVGYGPLLIAIGSAGFVYLSAVALGQQGVHEVLVHWRLAQTALAVVGVFALQDLGLHGGLFHSVASSLALSALLVLVGRDRSQATRDARPVRLRRWGTSLGFMSAIGVPGLAGFVGQSLLIMHILRWEWFDSKLPKLGGPWDWLWRSVVYGGILLSGGALVRVWHRSALPTGQQSAQRTAVGLLIVVLIVAMGLRPIPISDVIGPAVYRLLNQVQERVEQDLEQLAMLETPDSQRPAHVARRAEGDTLRAMRVPYTVAQALAGAQ